MKLGGVPDGYGNTLLIEGLAIGIAQLDIVVTGSKREFLGLLDAGRITAVDVHLGVLLVSLDLDFTEVLRHVARRIGVISVERIEGPKERPSLHNHDATPDSLCRSGRCHTKEKTPRDGTRQC